MLDWQSTAGIILASTVISTLLTSLFALFINRAKWGRKRKAKAYDDINTFTIELLAKLAKFHRGGSLLDDYGNLLVACFGWQVVVSGHVPKQMANVVEAISDKIRDTVDRGVDDSLLDNQPFPLERAILEVAHAARTHIK